jgi:hypothetical protein
LGNAQRIPLVIVHGATRIVPATCFTDIIETRKEFVERNHFDAPLVDRTRGQPSLIQRSMSTLRQRTSPPNRIGEGMSPISRSRQIIRVEHPHSVATWEQSRSEGLRGMAAGLSPVQGLVVGM